MLIEIKISANPALIEIDLNDAAVGRSYKTTILPKTSVKYLQLATDETHIEVILEDSTVYQVCALPVFTNEVNVFPIEVCGVAALTTNADLFARLILLLA